ncbi:MAG TPA: MFS transporter [Steroidobacteraceae bacterium]|nr:MFS transporter [Steroidobacteraceae bacterium]
MNQPSTSSSEAPVAESADKSYVGSPYAKYVLVVLTIVYVFNFVDRQIISILAEDIKRDLGVTDADLGILYGTVFAVFYALFGIPLGRLADLWMRKSMISIGLAFWSVMTALSGTAKTFGTLLGYRIGVGMGEASASPAAFSMLADYFNPKQRATVMAIYSSGVYIGGGIGLAIGGVVLDTWHAWFPDPASAPLGLKGWQMAFFLVGIPGILMAIWVKTLREPTRGMSEGITIKSEPHPFKMAGRELMGVFPVLNFINLVVNKATSKVIAINLLMLALTVAAAFGLHRLFPNIVQWVAMSIGVYCTFTWAQSLVLRSPDVFTAIFRNRTVMLACIAFPSIGFVGYGSNFFAIPYLLRAHNVSHAEIGTVIGLTAAVGAWLGISLGGFLADKLKQRWVHGRLLVGLLCIVMTLPFAYGVYFGTTLKVVYICNFFAMFFSPMYIGPATSTVNDLVPPQMRGTVSAVYLMMMTFIGLAMGPFTMGQISTAYAKTGMAIGPALRTGVAWGYLMLAVAFVLIIAACFTIKRDEARKTWVGAAAHGH